MLKHSIRNMVVAALVALGADTAVAASSTCFVSKVQQWCRTDSIPAQPIGHLVHLSLSPRLNYEVKDDTNGVIVGSGYAGLNGLQKTIPGLYARYSMLVLLPFTNNWGWGTLDNN
jgi:hypothetical protein